MEELRLMVLWSCLFICRATQGVSSAAQQYTLPQSPQQGGLGGQSGRGASVVSAGSVYLSICVTYYLWLNNRSLGYLALNVNNSNYLFNYRHSCACNLTIILTNQPTNQPSPQLNNAATSGVPSICCPITITCQLRPRVVGIRHVTSRRSSSQTNKNTHTKLVSPFTRASSSDQGSHLPREP